MSKESTPGGSETRKQDMFLDEWIHHNEWHWNFCSNKWGKSTERDNRIEKTTEQLAAIWYKLQQERLLPQVPIVRAAADT
jgi:hypothetical protein